MMDLFRSTSSCDGPIIDDFEQGFTVLGKWYAQENRAEWEVWHTVTLRHRFQLSAIVLAAY